MSKILFPFFARNTSGLCLWGWCSAVLTSLGWKFYEYGNHRTVYKWFTIPHWTQFILLGSSSCQPSERKIKCMEKHLSLFIIDQHNYTQCKKISLCEFPSLFKNLKVWSFVLEPVLFQCVHCLYTWWLCRNLQVGLAQAHDWAKRLSPSAGLTTTQELWDCIKVKGHIPHSDPLWSGFEAGSQDWLRLIMVILCSRSIQFTQRHLPSPVYKLEYTYHTYFHIIHTCYIAKNILIESHLNVVGSFNVSLLYKWSSPQQK